MRDKRPPPKIQTDIHKFRHFLPHADKPCEFPHLLVIVIGGNFVWFEGKNSSFDCAEIDGEAQRK